MTTIYLVRGHKSQNKKEFCENLAQQLKDTQNVITISASDYFEANHIPESYGEPLIVKQAHTYCVDKLRNLLTMSDVAVIVNNPFLDTKHMYPYMRLAQATDTNVCVYDYVSDTDTWKSRTVDTKVV